MSKDSRIVSGARCTWWDSIDKVGKNGAGLPCCPHCQSVLYEYPDEVMWFRGVDNYEAAGNPGYRKVIEWSRGKCFPKYAAAKYAYEHRLRGDIDVFCRANWDRVPAEHRATCLDHLRGWIRADIIAQWKAQHAAGERIASDTPGFHHLGGGMEIRNRLRDVMEDSELPAVVGPAGGYPLGEEMRNWDNFYTGALEELVETAA